MTTVSRTLLWISLLCVTPAVLSAQSLPGAGSGLNEVIQGITADARVQYEEKACGSDEHHAYRMNTDLAYKARHIKYKARLDSIRHSTPLSPRQSVQYTIPVVVHVIHLGEPIGTGTNISDAQILDAIDGLNDRFTNANGMGLDIEINFCLANRDPNGCPTSGINRVNGSGVPLYTDEGIQFSGGCGADEVAIKDMSLWPTWEYYNIWVVHDICGDIAGYAYYPNGDPYDGTVIEIASMNSSSRTLAHELGHGLNLAHTFNGDEEGSTCPSNSDCTGEGDEVCDTPPHKRNDCGNNNPCGSGGEWDDSRYNWMSYCPTSSELGRFTAEQGLRMRDALLVEPRSWLLASQGCANAENMRITSEDDLMCSGETRTLSATPAGGIFFIADGPGRIDGDVLTATGGGTIVVEYVVSLENCSSSVFQSISSKQTATSRLNSSEDNLCVGQSATLSGIPAGGSFSLISGPGTLEGNILRATGEGEIEVMYTVTVLGCVSTDGAVIVSNEGTSVGIEMLTDDLLEAIADEGTFQWVRCDLDYEVIDGATDQQYVVATSGSYAVILLDGACRDTSDCIEMEITSVDPTQPDDQIKIYPNPVSEVLYLDYEGAQSPINIILSDIQGKRITSVRFPSQPKTGLNVNGFAPGAYLMMIEVEGKGRYYYRFIKL